MRVLLVASSKGGTSKSTICRSFAVQGLIEGQRAAIIDGDPQGSIVSWGQRREASAPTIIGLDGKSLPDVLEMMKRAGADLVCIDTPPSVHPVINLAAAKADFIVITTGPYPEDLSALGRSVKIVKALAKPAAILLTRTPIRSSALALARSALTAFELPICPVAISQRVAHPYASSAGLTCQEWEPGGPAATEIADAWKWISERMSNGQDGQLRRPAARNTRSAGATTEA